MTETTQEKCRACHRVLQQPYPLGEKNGYKLQACRACGSVMVEPWVTDQEREEYFGEVEPQITHIPNHQNEVARIRKLLKKLDPNPVGKRFLDVGAQCGYAVSAAKELGMDVHGIDQHEFFVRFLHEKYENKEIFQHITLQEYAAANPSKKADIIYSTENFCMQTDPEGFAEALVRMLAPGGIIFIDEPDGNNFNLPRKFANWDIVYPPINFIYFSKRGMTALLARHGLKIRKSFFLWRPFMRLVVARK